MASSGVFVAQTAEQAQLLLSEAHFSLLYLLQTETHASHLAKLTRRPLRQTHHQLTRLLHAHLIEIVGEQRRPGRPLKLYRATASQYQIPFQFTDHTDLQATLRCMTGQFSDACAFYLSRLGPDLRGPDIQINVLAGDEGIVYSLVPPPDAGPQLREVMAGFRLLEVRLNHAHQQELAARIAELRQWIEDRQQFDQEAGTAEPCLISLLTLPGRLPVS